MKDLFFDRMYLQLSERINNLERNISNIGKEINWKSLTELLNIFSNRLDRLENDLYQYKNKVKRIERFLIEQGLIKLLNRENLDEV